METKLIFTRALIRTFAIPVSDCKTPPLPSIHLSVLGPLSVCLSRCLSDCLFVCLFVYLFVYLFLFIIPLFMFVSFLFVSVCIFFSICFAFRSFSSSFYLSCGFFVCLSV